MPYKWLFVDKSMALSVGSWKSFPGTILVRLETATDSVVRFVTPVKDSDIEPLKEL